MIENLPAKDDEILRELNKKKVYDMVDEITHNMRESKKMANVTKWYLIGLIILVGIMIVGSSITLAIKSGGISNFIDNYFILDNTNTRIVCEENNITMVFRSPTESKAFKETFSNSECYVMVKQ